MVKKIHVMYEKVWLYFMSILYYYSSRKSMPAAHNAGIE